MYFYKDTTCCLWNLFFKWIGLKIQRFKIYSREEKMTIDRKLNKDKKKEILTILGKKRLW